tara:strand:+ start:220 stop:720 length:501 start_codon:yes stop_codon:yes gene_type:complete
MTIEPNKTITIQGLDFTASTPYDEGHVVTLAEAKALNQVRLENLRNNFASKIKAAKGEAEALTSEQAAALTSEFAAYDAEYVFTLASVGGGKRETDPVMVEAKKIARAKITAALQAAGRKVKDVDAEKLADAIAAMAEKDDVQAMAKKVVKARQTAAADDVDLGDL